MGTMEYVHFDHPYICQEFVLYVKSKNIKVSQHVCCTGKGCALYDISIEEIDILKEMFLEQYQPRCPIVPTTMEDICCVCYTSTWFTTKCFHAICQQCVSSLNICPLCRRLL
jgi:hypothetical protein